MGAWGYGILQNDTAQDGMCIVADRIKADILALPDKASEDSAAKIGAATGLLLMISPFSFHPDNELYQPYIEKLKLNRSHFSALPGKSADLLNAIIDGQGLDLAERIGTLDSDIDRALHSDENFGFPVQKDISLREDDLFRHPGAADYVQQVTYRLVEEVAEGFQDDDVVSDLSREAEFMGAFSLLLVFPKAKVDPAKFIEWRDSYRRVMKNAGPDEDEAERKFQEEYDRYLELAFAYGIQRYSGD
jgi:hypothetical protein